MAVLVKQLAAAELGWANACYAEVDFLPSPATDLVVVAEVDGTAAGLGRATRVAPGIGELGGMYVFPGYRGAGVARALIGFLVSRSGLGTLYCLPFEHLAALYRSAGFEPCHAGPAVPAKVLEKHAWCNAHYPEPVLLLRRDDSAQDT